MVGNLTAIVPFHNGHEHINKLIQSIPLDIPVLVIDDQSEDPLFNRWADTRRVTVVRPTYKGYFTGAVNVGLDMTETDVLILNQDTWFDNAEAFEMIDDRRNEGFAVVGERIHGTHPTFGSFGYIHGTFMFIRRDAVETVGHFNEEVYPLWGSTAEWSLRAARKLYSILPLAKIPGFHHARSEDERYGSSIKSMLDATPTAEKGKFIRTPPLLSVIIPCYNYGHYIADAVSSLIGGVTSLGFVSPQTLQSFEIIIVDDASRDKSWEKIQAIVSDPKGIRAYRLEKNVGTAAALNYGIGKAVGQYITFLSADDMREPWSLEKLVEACQKNPHSFAYDDVMLFARDKKVKTWKMADYDFEEILYKNHVHAGIVFPKVAWEQVGGYPEVMRDGREDWAFNVALGIKGWCGEHVEQPGYLYRREHQNRSLNNTSPFHHERFLRKISGLFPEVYGGYRPEMCCGKKNKTINRAIAPVNQLSLSRSVTINSLTGGSNMASPTGAEGMVELVYNGKQQPAVWDGNVTNTRYRFGVGKERGWVDVRDAGERGVGRGFLTLKDSQGAWLFTALTEPAVVPVVVNAVAMPRATMTVSKATVESIAEPQVSVLVAEEPMNIESTTMELQGVNPAEYNAKEIMAMEMTTSEWRTLYEREMSSEKPRKGLTTWLEEKLASV